MKQQLIALPLLVFFFSSASIAQTVIPADAERLFNFAQVAEPGLFNPSTETQQVNEGDSDWFFRDFTGSGNILGISINGNGPFYSGDVYALGPGFGNGPVFLGSLSNLLTYIDNLSPLVTLEDANVLFNYAELADPVRFSPQVQTQLINELNSDWYVRFYSDSGVYIKINLNGTSPFAAGNVYVVGGAYGGQEIFLGTLENILASTKTKDFVSDLRDLIASAQIAAFEDELGAFGNSVTLAFEEKIDPVSGVVTNDMGEVVGAISLAVDAFTLALKAVELDPNLTTFDVDYGSGLIVTTSIDNSGTSPVFSIDQNIIGVDVSVTASSFIQITETGAGLSGGSTIDIALTIHGTAVNDEFLFAIEEGSQVSATRFETYSESGLEEYSTVSLPTVSVDLLVSVTALQADNNPTFNGEFGFAIADLVIDSSSIAQQGENQSTFTYKDLIRIGSIEFSISGLFSDDTGNSVGATFAMSIGKTGGQDIQFEIIETATVTFNPFTYFSFSETNTNETAENFLSSNVFFQIDVALPGIDNSSMLTLEANRTGLRNEAAVITFHFNGKFLKFEADTAGNSIFVSNQDNVVAQVRNNLFTGLLEGTITIDELEVASIEELPSGILIIRYTDGTFESLAL